MHRCRLKCGNRVGIKGEDAGHCAASKKQSESVGSINIGHGGCFESHGGGVVEDEIPGHRVPGQLDVTGIAPGVVVVLAVVIVTEPSQVGSMVEGVDPVVEVLEHLSVWGGADDRPGGVGQPGGCRRAGQITERDTLCDEAGCSEYTVEPDDLTLSVVVGFDHQDGGAGQRTDAYNGGRQVGRTHRRGQGCLEGVLH